MTKESSNDQENQMALFGLPEKPKPVTEAVKTKKAAQAKPSTTKGKTTVPPKKKTSTKKAVASPPRGRSGLVPEGDVRLTANIREDLHLRLKIAAAKQRTTIGEIIEGLVEKYVK